MGSETYDVKKQGGESRGDASLGSRLHYGMKTDRMWWRVLANTSISALINIEYYMRPY